MATGAAWQVAQSLAAPEIAPQGDSVIQVSPELSIFSGWLGLDVDAIISRAEVSDGLPLAQLHDVAVYKRLLGRPKDQAHLKLLEPYLIR